MFSASLWKVCVTGIAVPKESQSKAVDFTFHGTPAQLRHGDIVIAAITCCTNTSNPNVMIGAALVVKKACDFGLEVGIPSCSFDKIHNI